MMATISHERAAAGHIVLPHLLSGQVGMWVLSLKVFGTFELFKQ